MNLRTTTVLICAAAVLAGCGSSSRTATQFSNGVTAEFSQAFRQDSSYTEYQALEAEGIVYYVGRLDGTVDEVRVRTNAARDRLFVAFNGGPEQEFDTAIGPVTNAGGVFQATFARNFGLADEQQVNIRVDGGFISSSIVVRDNIAPVAIGGTSEGLGGLATLQANLPTGATMYAGDFNTFVEDVDTMALTVDTLAAISTTTNDLTIDFGDSTLSGTHAGTTTLGGNGNVSGNITGEVIGSRAGGTLTVTGDNTGSLNFAGQFTGETANNLVGGVAGTVNDGATDHTVGGEFNLIKQ